MAKHERTTDGAWPCPVCGSLICGVVDTRAIPGAAMVKRFRKCENGHRFKTIEIMWGEFQQLAPLATPNRLRHGRMTEHIRAIHEHLTRLQTEWEKD